jgi:hypothetical protein
MKSLLCILLLLVINTHSEQLILHTSTGELVYTVSDVDSITFEDVNDNEIVGTWYSEASAQVTGGVTQRTGPDYMTYKKEFNLIFEKPDIFTVKSFYTQISTDGSIFTGVQLDSLLMADSVENPVSETGTWSTSNDTLTYDIPSEQTYVDPYWINSDTLFIDMDGSVLFYQRK